MNKGEKITATYLYADNHAKQVIEKTDSNGVTYTYVNIIEKFSPHLKFGNFRRGRIIVGEYRNGMANLLKLAELINIHEETIEIGSEKTKSMRIPIGYLELQVKGIGLLQFDSISTIYGPEYTYQPDVNEMFDAGLGRWSTYPVGKIIRAKVSVHKV